MPHRRNERNGKLIVSGLAYPYQIHYIPILFHLLGNEEMTFFSLDWLSSVYTAQPLLCLLYNPTLLITVFILHGELGT